MQGAKGQKEKQQLAFSSENVECLEVLAENWRVAVHVLQTLKTQGITLPLTDALIATIAKRYQVAVLTMDKHFVYLGVSALEI